MSLSYTFSNLSPCYNAAAATYAKYSLFSNLTFYAKVSLITVSAIYLAYVSLVAFTLVGLGYLLYNNFIANDNRNNASKQVPPSSIFGSNKTNDFNYHEKQSLNLSSKVV